MREMVRRWSKMKKQVALTLLGLAMAFAFGACNWHSYLVTRGVRQVTGKKMRFHGIVPMQTTLGEYQVLEVKKLDNLILDQIPPQMEQYIDDKVFKELASLKLFPEVVRQGDEIAPEGANAVTTPKGTLIFEGAIDDYSPGYRGLRYAELGFNHVAVTVHFQLKDKQTGAVIGSASITAQDNRATASTKSAIDRIAKRIKGFINSGFKEHEK
jgi:hypothetical protein